MPRPQVRGSRNCVARPEDQTALPTVRLQEHLLRCVNTAVQCACGAAVSTPCHYAWPEHLAVFAPSAARPQVARTGEPAGGPTGEEVGDVVTQFQECYNKKKAEYNAAHPGAEIEDEPIWSWDNNRIHNAAAKRLRELGITRGKQSGLPPLSPDMHSVIETCHGTVAAELQKFINLRTPQPGDTLQVYIDELYRIHERMITPQWVQHAVWRLFKDVLPAIIDCHGEYADKKHR